MRPIVTLLALLSLALLSSCGRDDEPGVPVAPVTFAVYGNTGLALDNGIEFGSLVSAINGQGVDFAVDLGNRLPGGVPSGGVEALWSEVDEDMEKFTVPVYPVSGANDIFDSRSDVIYTERYGPPWYSFTRGGVAFIALHTGDESYDRGLGVLPRIGDEQVEWLKNAGKKAGDSPVVLFLNRPLWNTDPRLWEDTLLPALRGVKVSLAVACSPEGLCDWETVDGIRAVATGCTGPTAEKGVGLFPHALLVTMKGSEITFRTLAPDGAVQPGIPVDRSLREEVNRFASAIQPPALEAGEGWRIGQTFSLEGKNTFSERITGELSFRVFNGTLWNIQPFVIPISIEPGAANTFHLDVRGTPPELGPPPVYRLSLKVGATEICDLERTMEVKIPKTRTGIPIPIEARIADRIPWNFGASPVRIPVDVGGPDTCGRLAVYRTDDAGAPVCVHFSGLRDFRPGINEFVWNGADLQGRRVTEGPLTCLVFVYNKKAPATWVADGPPGEAGAFEVQRGPSGLIGATHSEKALVEYRIGASRGDPQPADAGSLEELLDGLPLIGFARDGNRRIFLSAATGVECVFTSGGKLRPDVSFADNGYLRLPGYRGRAIGSPAFGGGKLYLALGGGAGKGPSVLVIDSESGRIDSEIDLTEYFGEIPEPAAIAADARGLYLAHPDRDIVLMLSPEGDVQWMNESGDDIGDFDADGCSFIYGIGVDGFGNSYVAAPGTSARCGVIGPDGRGLFRVILVQLPGLRVSSAIPCIEGKSSDGLYFVTRGGDRPYVFHVPFTVRRGEIVRESPVKP
ncbi:MAG: metallophosphoesterase family protein [Candidatus Latescibacterota bacterium]